MTAIAIPTSHSTYGRVVCRIIRRVGDGDDAGTEPDALPMSGAITFTPLTQWDRTTDYSALASNEAITGQLNPLTGEMMSPGQPPTIGVDLLVGVYSVNFDLDHGTFASFNVEVKASHTAVAPLDLAHEVPYSPPPGVQTTVLVPSGITDGYLLSVSGGALIGVDPATLGGGGSGGPVAWADITDKPAVVAAGATQADARTAIGAGTSSFDGAYSSLSGKPTLGTAADNAETDFATAAQGTKADSALQPTIADAKGDLIVGTGSDTVGRLPVGANGYVPKAASGEATGIKWTAPGEGSVSTVATSGAAQTLSAAYELHDVTMSANCTFTFTSPAAGAVFALRLAGAFTPTWPASVDWPDGSAPTYATPSLYVFATFDGGTTWLGVQTGKAFA